MAPRSEQEYACLQRRARNGSPLSPLQQKNQQQPTAGSNFHTRTGQNRKEPKRTGNTKRAGRCPTVSPVRTPASNVRHLYTMQRPSKTARNNVASFRLPTKPRNRTSPEFLSTTTRYQLTASAGRTVRQTRNCGTRAVARTVRSQTNKVVQRPVSQTTAKRNQPARAAVNLQRRHVAAGRKSPANRYASKA